MHGPIWPGNLTTASHGEQGQPQTGAPALYGGLSRIQTPVPCLLTRYASFSAALMLVTLRMPKAMEYESMEDSGKGRASALPCTHCSDWLSAGRRGGSRSAAHMSRVLACLTAEGEAPTEAPVSGSPLPLAQHLCVDVADCDTALQADIAA